MTKAEKKQQKKAMKSAFQKVYPEIKIPLKTQFENSFVSFNSCQYDLEHGMLRLIYRFQNDNIKINIDIVNFQHCFIDDSFDKEKVLREVLTRVKNYLSCETGNVNKRNFMKDSEDILNAVKNKLKEQVPWTIVKKGTLKIGDYTTKLNIGQFLTVSDIVLDKIKDDYGFVITTVRLPCSEEEFIQNKIEEIRKTLAENYIELNNYKPNMNVQSVLEDLIATYERAHSPFLRKPSNLLHFSKVSYSCKNCDLNDVYCVSEHFEFRIKDEKIEDLQYKGKFKTFIESHNLETKKAEDYILREIENFPYKLEYSSGKGLLMDGMVDAIVWDKNRINKTIVVLKCPDIKTTGWTDRFLESLNQAKEAIETFFRQEEEKIAKKFKTVQYSILAKAILQVVEANKDFITENGIVAVLRGTKPTYEVSTSNCKYLGQFNYLTIDEVKAMIYRLVHANILELNSIYTKYDTCYDSIRLKVGSTQKFFGKTPESPSTVKIKIQNTKSLNFFEAELYFKSLNQNSLSTSDYIEALHLIKMPEFICIYEDEYVEIFKNAPKEFKMYVKMIRENTEDRRLRKVYKKIIDVVGKE